MHRIADYLAISDSPQLTHGELRRDSSQPPPGGDLGLDKSVLLANDLVAGRFEGEVLPRLQPLLPEAMPRVMAATATARDRRSPLEPADLDPHLGMDQVISDVG